MSKIAEALAKAREQTGHTTAPFLRGEVPPDPSVVSPAKATLLRRAKRAHRFWMIIGPLALVITAIVVWSRWSEIFPPQAPVAVANSGDATPAPALNDSAQKEAETLAPSRVVLTPPPPPPVTVEVVNATADVALPPPPLIQPSPAILRQVNDLVVSAVMPGERPRLMYRGRVVNVGERVEAEITFAGIQNGDLVFHDSRGAVYTRRP